MNNNQPTQKGLPKQQCACCGKPNLKFHWWVDTLLGKICSTCRDEAHRWSNPITFTVDTLAEERSGPRRAFAPGTIHQGATQPL